MKKVYIKDKQDNKVLPYTHVDAVLDDEGNSLSSHLGAFEDEVRGLVDTPHQEYVTVATYASLPASGSEDTIYRVSNYDGSQSQVAADVYSEYAWDGTQYVFLCVKSAVGEVFDISAYHNNAKYADLNAALTSNTGGVPQSLQKGGMSVKFVQSSDNKYVQYRLMSDSFNTTPANWQGVDDALKDGSINLIESGAVYTPTHQNSVNASEVDKSIPQNSRYVILESGGIENGVDADVAGRIRSVNLIPITSSPSLVVKQNGSTLSTGYRFYNSDKEYIGNTYDANAVYFRFIAIASSVENISVTVNGDVYLTEKYQKTSTKSITDFLAGKSFSFPIVASGGLSQRCHLEGGKTYLLYTDSYDVNSKLFFNSLNGVGYNIAFTYDGDSLSASGRLLTAGIHIIVLSQDVEYVRITNNTISETTIIIAEKTEITEKQLKKINEAVFGKEISTISTTTISSPWNTYDCALIANKEYLFVVSTSDTNANIYIKDAGAGSVGNNIPAYWNGQLLNYYQKIPSGIYIVKPTANATGIRVTNNTSALVFIGIYDDSGLKFQSEKLQNEENTLEGKINDIVSTAPILPSYSQFAPNVISRYINGAYAEENISLLHDIIKDGEPVHHDSTLAIINGVAYVVYTANANSGNNASSPTAKVRLTKFSLSDYIETEYTVAEKDGVYGDYTQTGGAGSPTLYAVGNVLHIIYSAEIGGIHSQMHTTFNVENNTFGTYSKLTLEDLPLDMQALVTLFGTTSTAFNAMQMNCTIGYYNGIYYAGLDYGYGTGKAILIKSIDLINWEIVTIISDYTDITPALETACYAEDGYVYIAQRPWYVYNEDGVNIGAQEQFGIVAKWDIANNKWISKFRFNNCSTRPSFFKKSNTLYLSTAYKGRYGMELIKINKAALGSSEISMQFVSSTRWGAYPSFVYYNNQMYLTASLIGHIGFASITIDEYTEAQIQNKFLSLMAEQ